MPEREPHSTPSLDAEPDQPLIGVIVQQDGHQVVRYFADEQAVDAAVSHGAVERALSAIGSWSDLDFDETLDALDRIRHESRPTPPIDLDV